MSRALQTSNHPQSASSAFLVAPSRFRWHPEAAEDNHYMIKPDVAGSGDNGEASFVDQAMREWTSLVDALRAAGVKVLAWVPHDVDSPDAVFPNNWISIRRQPDAETPVEAVLYPMKPLARRGERSAGALRALSEHYDGADKPYKSLVRPEWDLASLEDEGHFLEGTGSIVMDHRSQVAYVARSERSTEHALEVWHQRAYRDYELCVFSASDSEAGNSIYHTNVLLSVGTGWAVVCATAIAEDDRARVLARLGRQQHTIAAGSSAGTESGKAGSPEPEHGDTTVDLVQISEAQTRKFAGNVLEVAYPPTRAFPLGRAIAMSQSAHDAFLPEQREKLLRHVDQFIVVEVPLIERVGGGSVRCMICELW